METKCPNCPVRSVKGLASLTAENECSKGGGQRSDEEMVRNMTAFRSSNALAPVAGHSAPQTTAGRHRKPSS